MGRTGGASGIHLHLEVFQDGITLNPLSVLPENEFLAIRPYDLNAHDVAVVASDSAIVSAKSYDDAIAAAVSALLLRGRQVTASWEVTEMCYETCLATLTRRLRDPRELYADTIIKAKRQMKVSEKARRYGKSLSYVMYMDW